MLAPEQTVTGPAVSLPTIDLRATARRLVIPAAIAAVAVAAMFVLGGHVRAFFDALVRGLDVSPVWAVAAVLFEAASLAGYVVLLALVAGRATPRVGTRESAEITLAGAAATRLLPTAGAGGIALALWALRRAGLGTGAATRTLLAFLVLLYSVFLGSIVLAGGALALGLARGGGPEALSAIPAAVAAAGIAAALGFARARRRPNDGADASPTPSGSLTSRVHHGGLLVGGAVHDAVALVRTADRRLAGAVGYWIFDAAVLWAMLNAFGSPPSLAVVALAYFVGQAANTLPIPGSVSGGIAGVLVAFGVPVALALPGVLAYRAIAVWLPAPIAAAAIPRLRATISRWSAEDASAGAS
jgi:putative heme transporter